MFQRAVKREARGRVALVGPAGAGKSFTMLKLARALAGPKGRIAAIDTEHGSLSKYAHTEFCGGAGVCREESHFEFDCDELASYGTDAFLKSLEEAERAGYAVFCCDSLSHFWMGKDGALEYVDGRAKRNNNSDSFSGWKDFRPKERAMVDAMLASPLHVIVTMRTKNEYVTAENAKGKKVRQKIGLAPVQRDGIEYEFDLVGVLDDDNTLIVDKTRCFFYAGKALAKPGAKEFQPFIEWLTGAPAGNSKTPGESCLGQHPVEHGRAEGPAAPVPAVVVVESAQLAAAAGGARSSAVPGPLRMIFGDLHKPGIARGALEMAHAKLREARPEDGDADYLRFVEMHGLKSGGMQIGRVKAALLDMYALIEFANEEKLGGLGISDDDLPPVLAGAGFGAAGRGAERNGR